mmetsp:Transcript_42979/g.112972  ORF Transcript_42979/g.112972 Transcript_42979/m.112972 type:complete len:207 (-) Transcript_42979:287-907(-)
MLSVEVGRRLLHDEESARDRRAEGSGDAAAGADGHIIAKQDIFIDQLPQIARRWQGNPLLCQIPAARPDVDHRPLRAHAQPRGTRAGHPHHLDEEGLPVKVGAAVTAVQEGDQLGDPGGVTGLVHQEHPRKSHHNKNQCAGGVGQPSVKHALRSVVLSQEIQIPLCSFLGHQVRARVGGKASKSGGNTDDNRAKPLHNTAQRLGAP